MSTIRIDENQKKFEEYIRNHGLNDSYTFVKSIINNEIKNKLSILKIKNFLFSLPESSEYIEPTIEIFFKRKEGLKKIDYFKDFHHRFDKILAQKATSLDEFKKFKLMKNEFRLIISVK